MVRFIDAAADISSYIHHLRVEIAYPVHLQLFISYLRRVLNHFRSGYNKCGFHAFPLMIGYNAEHNTEHGLAALKPSIPTKQELAPQCKLSIRVFDDQLVYVRCVYPECNRFASVIGKPYNFRVEDGLHALHKL